MPTPEPVTPDSLVLIHDDLVTLWNNQNSSATKLAPMFYGEPRHGELISVGLNPAFSKDGTAGWNHIKGVGELKAIHKKALRRSW